MTNRNIYLVPGAPTLVEPLAVPLQATSRQVAHGSIKPLDTLLASGVRVLLEAGLRGGDAFLIPNGVDPSAATRKYPDKSTRRVVGRLSGVSITPGSFVGMDVLALPSGALARNSTAGEISGGALAFSPDGAGGSIQLEVTYTNGDAQTVTVTSTIDIPGSPAPFAAEPANAHGAVIIKSADAIPTGPMVPSSSWWQRWCRGQDVTVAIELSYIGSPRPIDVAVVERPSQLVVDEADSRWPSAMYGNGFPYVELPGEYPVEQLTTASPSSGTRSIRRALYAHGRELGPMLVGWTSATEHVGDLDDWISYDAGTGDDEAPPATVNGTTEELVAFGAGITTPGWIAGHYARQADHGTDFLDAGTGVLPVTVAAYCKVGAGTGTYRFATVDGWSEITWTTASTSWVWIETPGWLEVGTGPEDSLPERLYLSNNGANDTHIRALGVFARVRG